MLSAYLGTWAFKVPLGLVQPAANLAYFYYSDVEWVDRALYVIYWPCNRLFPFAIHERDRTFPSLQDMGP